MKRNTEVLLKKIIRMKEHLERHAGGRGQRFVVT
jgi:hypothetical protein